MSIFIERPLELGRVSAKMISRVKIPSLAYSVGAYFEHMKSGKGHFGLISGLFVSFAVSSFVSYLFNVRMP